MPDIENVIKGLECCSAVPEHDCENCPYDQETGDYICGSREMKREAIELLKEQEAKTGEWITIWQEDDPDTSLEARCSVCGRVSKRPLGHYCKWCGSTMDKE